jgi:hypothetical protein
MCHAFGMKAKLKGHTTHSYISSEIFQTVSSINYPFGSLFRSRNTHAEDTCLIHTSPHCIYMHWCIHMHIGARTHAFTLAVRKGSVGPPD